MHESALEPVLVGVLTLRLLIGSTIVTHLVCTTASALWVSCWHECAQCEDRERCLEGSNRWKWTSVEGWNDYVIYFTHRERSQLQHAAGDVTEQQQKILRFLGRNQTLIDNLSKLHIILYEILTTITKFAILQLFFFLKMHKKMQRVI